MKVKQLYTYPIKSLRGTSLDSFVPTYQGFQYDRRFMLLKNDTEPKNMHVAHFPEMCLFTTDIIFPNASDPGRIVVEYHAPGTEKPKRTEIPLLPDVDKLGLEEVKITMHSSTTVGYNMGKQYNDWFSDCFGFEVILAYIGKNRREILGNVPPSKALATAKPQAKGWMETITSNLPILSSSTVPGVDEGIAFSDCAPYLVITEKSWENASHRLPPGETMDISKFRPNIIISGAETEFEEDFWGELEIGGLKLILTQNCARCNSLNVDYKTGKVGEGESGKILKKLQSDRRVDPGAKWSPIFGRYGFLDRFEGERRISVGDEVEVTKRNEERSRFGEFVSLLLCLMLMGISIFLLTTHSCEQSGQISARIESIPLTCMYVRIQTSRPSYPVSVQFILVLLSQFPSPSLSSPTSPSSLRIPSPSLASSCVLK